ncbi:uncharacterized protein LOC131255796 [Magnolia sinica]|uniref:uncharacterized protein LOC131255796 n=1 Tax=Magnolia sinica TaxID=86752 RepID=UPI00265AD1B2|nr:uncharacterized protein LOC131255796 [Magnolia sinica]
MASTSTSPTSSKLVLAWTLVFLSLTLPTTPLKIPKLGVVPRTSRSSYDAESLAADGFETLYYTQTLDHFNYRPESYTTFQQRYVVNSRYWGGPNVSAPIFVYTGDESGLFNDINAAGFLTDNAPHYKSLLVYIEHRYYGESTPFGSMDEAFRNASTLGYFSSAQALADYAELIIDLKKNLSAENCPVIAYGGSYGGMLASWFRLKYPHIAIGAVASSAPILYFDDITPENGYFSVVTKDYRETSESCYSTIRQSWFEIDTIASQSNGLTLLSQKFHTCSPLNDTQELKDYIGILFVAAAQYNYPPKYPVNVICNAIDGAPQGTDILGRIFAAVVAREGRQRCYSVTESDHTGGTIGPWTYQRCTEMVMPIGCGSNDTMFQAQPFDLKNYTDECRNMSGVTPRPHWITTEFGGHDIKSVLQRFSSNIIFSNGLRDPYSVGGVLQNISDSVVAIYTTQGAHCMDIYSTRPDDPEWVIWQRNEEINIIDGWIAHYYADLAARTTNQA